MRRHTKKIQYFLRRYTPEVSSVGTCPKWRKENKKKITETYNAFEWIISEIVETVKCDKKGWGKCLTRWMQILLLVTREPACNSILPAHVPSFSMDSQYSSNGTSSSIKGSNSSRWSCYIHYIRFTYQWVKKSIKRLKNSHNLDI